MRILLTGSEGYVGSVLRPLLESAGHQVTGYDIWTPQDCDHAVIKGDVNYLDLFKAAVEGKDAVIHLAMKSNNDWIEANLKEADNNNITYFPLLLQWAKRLGVKLFVYASSVAAYGNWNDEVPETRTLAPTTMYGHHKAFCEKWVQATQSDDFACVRVRSASVCGWSPRMRYDLTVNKMVKDALETGEIRVNGGEQKRCHVHIKDLCDFYDALVHVFESDLSRDTAMAINGQAFNVVATNESVLDTAKRVAEATGAKIIQLPRSDSRSYSVSGKKARDILGWEPRWTIDDAIREMKEKWQTLS